MVATAHDDIARRQERLRKLETLRLWRKQDAEKKKFLEAREKIKELERYEKKAIWWHKNQEYEEKRLLRQTQIEVLKNHVYTTEYKRYYSHINREHINNMKIVPKEWAEWMERRLKNWTDAEEERGRTLVTWMRETIRRTNYKSPNVRGTCGPPEDRTPDRSPEQVAQQNVARYLRRVIKKALLEFVSRIMLIKIAEIINRCHWVSEAEGANPSSLAVSACRLERRGAPCGVERPVLCASVNHASIGTLSLVLKPSSDIGFYWTILLGAGKLPCDPSRLGDLRPPACPHVAGLKEYLLWRGDKIVNYPLPKNLKDIYNIKYVKSMLYDIDCPVFLPIYNMWNKSGHIYINPEMVRKYLIWKDKKMRQKEELCTDDIVRNIVNNWLAELAVPHCTEVEKAPKQRTSHGPGGGSCAAKLGNLALQVFQVKANVVTIKKTKLKPEEESSSPSLNGVGLPQKEFAKEISVGKETVDKSQETNKNIMRDSRVKFVSKTYIEPNVLKTLDIETEELKRSKNRSPTPHPSVTELGEDNNKFDQKNSQQIANRLFALPVKEPSAIEEEYFFDEMFAEEETSDAGRSVTEVIKNLTSEEKICTVCDLRDRIEESSETETQESQPLEFEHREAPPVTASNLLKKKKLIKKPMRSMLRKIYGWVMTTVVRRRILISCELPSKLKGERFYKPRFDSSTVDLIRGLSKLILERSTSNYPFIVLEPYIDIILEMTMDASKRHELTKRLVRLAFPLTDEAQQSYRQFYFMTNQHPFCKAIYKRVLSKMGSIFSNRDITKEFAFYVNTQAGEYVDAGIWVPALGIRQPDDFPGDYIEEIVRWSPWYKEPVKCDDPEAIEEEEGEDYPLPDFDYVHKRPDYRDPKAHMTNKERVLDIAINKLDLRPPQLRKITPEVIEEFKFHNKDRQWKYKESMREFHKRIGLFYPLERPQKRKMY